MELLDLRLSPQEVQVRLVVDPRTYPTLAASTRSHVRPYLALKYDYDTLTHLATADADPLGVDMNVSFDNVGGLDGRKMNPSRD